MEIGACQLIEATERTATLKFPEANLLEWWSVRDNPIVVKSNQVSLKIGPPRRPRSTGFRSQNSRIYGHCKDISLQLSVQGKVYDTDYVYRAMKQLAVGQHNYPMVLNDISGELEPKSQADCTVEEADILNVTIQEYADANKLWLTEYQEVGKKLVPYKSLYGKSREEMRRDFPEVNGDE